MYKIAVCDDDPTDAAYITNCIEQWAARQERRVQTECFPSAEAFLFRYEEEKAFDILCLDIEMGAMSGMELAGKLRENDRSVQIIFITGYMEYIADGYDVEALHYLLKPITPEKLGGVLDRAAQRVTDREKALYLQTEGSMVRIPVGEIRYLEVRRNYVTIHGREDYTVKKTLAELEKELDEGFFRTGRSFIVNLRFVRKITKSEVLLKDETAVPLSRGLYDSANRAMIQYF
ncbi:MAG: LytTR family DNA-binding domain-containing protein [Roseburia sp.]|nr:LytTR family DNA-binding domain-containing protein [Roseburia sp.]